MFKYTRSAVRAMLCAQPFPEQTLRPLSNGSSHRLDTATEPGQNPTVPRFDIRLRSFLRCREDRFAPCFFPHAKPPATLPALSSRVSGLSPRSATAGAATPKASERVEWPSGRSRCSTSHVNACGLLRKLISRMSCHLRSCRPGRRDESIEPAESSCVPRTKRGNRRVGHLHRREGCRWFWEQPAAA